MPRVRETGDGDEYTSEEEAALEAAVDDAWADYEAAAERTPSRMTTRARVEWAGVEQRSNNGVRTLRADNLNLGRVRDAARASRAAAEQARRTGPSTSYRAKGWHAQLRALTGDRHGSQLADRSGLNPTSRTLRSWLAEDRAPNKANQARIASAYDALRNRARNDAQQISRAANHTLQQELTDALRDRYGATIRLRDIEWLNLDN